jgi:hypothetical protein
LTQARNLRSGCANPANKIEKKGAAWYDKHAWKHTSLKGETGETNEF